MGLANVFGRLQKLMTPRVRSERISSNEYELNSYLERDRQENIKKLVHEYRLKDANQILVGQKMETGSTILENHSDVFRTKPQHRIMAGGQSSILGSKKKRILGGGRGGFGR